MTSQPEDYEMSDLPLPGITLGHDQRLHELVNRRADAPPFPDTLPPRPPSPAYKQWLLPSILRVLLLISMGANACLGVFLGKERSTVTDLQIQMSTISLTVTTRVSTDLPTAATSFQTVTSTPYPTCNPLERLRLATNYYAMVKDCNCAIADIEKNDCMDGSFCEINLECKFNSNSFQHDLSPQMAGCCGWCGCYENHSGVIWLKNEVLDHQIGLIAEVKTAIGLVVRAVLTEMATMVLSVVAAIATNEPMLRMWEAESQSLIDAVPLTSGAARPFRKWWSRTGFRHGVRKIWKMYKQKY